MRKDPVAPEGFQAAWNSITRELEHAGARVFAVWANGCTALTTLQPDVASWSRPSLTMLAGTILGAADFARYRSFGDWRRENGRPVFVDGRPVIDPPRPGLRMEEQVDALLYLGSPDEMRFGGTMTDDAL